MQQQVSRIYECVFGNLGITCEEFVKKKCKVLKSTLRASYFSSLGLLADWHVFRAFEFNGRCEVPLVNVDRPTVFSVTVRTAESLCVRVLAELSHFDLDAHEPNFVAFRAVVLFPTPMRIHVLFPTVTRVRVRANLITRGTAVLLEANRAFLGFLGIVVRDAALLVLIQTFQLRAFHAGVAGFLTVRTALNRP